MMANKFILLLLISLQMACSSLQADTASEEVSEFIGLLVSDKQPSLSDYKKFYGGSSEDELFFEKRSCQEKGWSVSSKECIQFVRNRWANDKAEISLLMDWVRTNFSTVGKPYKILHVTRSSDGFQHSVVEVAIGEHEYTLFWNTSSERYTGLLVGISSVDGKTVNSYLNK